jgi:hypothetical protein
VHVPTAIRHIRAGGIAPFTALKSAVFAPNPSARAFGIGDWCIGGDFQPSLLWFIDVGHKFPVLLSQRIYSLVRRG